MRFVLPLTHVPRIFRTNFDAHASTYQSDEQLESTVLECKNQQTDKQMFLFERRRRYIFSDRYDIVIYDLGIK